MSLKTTIALLNAFAYRVLAHGIVTEFYTDGVKNAGFATDTIYRIQNGNPVPDIAAWSTTSTDRAYVEPNNMQTLDINCHQDAKPGVLTAEVAAGGKVDLFWADWPHNIGPVLTYIANCNGDCSQADKATLKWIRIDEAGCENGVWAGKKLMENNFTWTTTVPSTIAPGNYVFRNEIINLHSGVEPNGAQLYPQCMNVEIVGGGSDVPEGTLGVDLYHADDAGILFDPYAKGMEVYPLPGPPLYVASSGSAPVAIPISAQVPAASATSPPVPSVNATVPTATNTPIIKSSVVPTLKPTTLVTRIASQTAKATSSQTGYVGSYCGTYNKSGDCE